MGLVHAGLSSLELVLLAGNEHLDIILYGFLCSQEETLSHIKKGDFVGSIHKLEVLQLPSVILTVNALCSFVLSA